MKRTMFNLFSLPVVLALLLPVGGIPITAPESRMARLGPASESLEVTGNTKNNMVSDLLTIPAYQRVPPLDIIHLPMSPAPDLTRPVADLHISGSIIFTQHTVDSNFVAAISVSAADMDGDGDVDVVGVPEIGGTGTAWWENDGNENFTRHGISSLNGLYTVSAVDMDRDGAPDILEAAYSSDTIRWWKNSGFDAFTVYTITNSFSRPTMAYAVDLDNDSDVDVLGPSLVSDRITWWENDGHENFVGHDIATGFDGAGWAHATDVDGDGDKDVIGTAAFANTVAWWENDGHQNFVKHTVTSTYNNPTSVSAADLDGDSHMDIVASGTTSIVWWENDGNQNFSAHTIAALANGTTSRLHLIDLDSDGDVDILCTDALGGSIAWWENDGHGIFAKHIITNAFPDAQSVYTVDLDSDGDLDVLGAARGPGDILWWENTSGVPLISPAVLGFGTTFAQKDISISPRSPGDTWTLSENIPWLSLSSISGTGQATVAASVNRTGLSSGTYTSTINGVVSGQVVTVNATMKVVVPQVTLITPSAGSTVYQSDSLLVKALVTLDGQPMIGGQVEGNIDLIGPGYMKFLLYDDGNHEDGAADDGIYAARITLYGGLTMPTSGNPYAMIVIASVAGQSGSVSSSINVAMNSGAPVVTLQVNGPTAPDFFVSQKVTVTAVLAYPDSSIHTDTAVTVTVTRPDLKVAQVGLTNVTTDTWRSNYTFPAGQGGLYYMDARADPPTGSGFVDGWKTLTPTLYVYQGALNLTVETSSGPWPLYSQVPLSVCVTSGLQPVNGAVVDLLSAVPAIEQQGAQLTEADTSGCYQRDYMVQASGLHTVTFQAQRAAYKTGIVTGTFQVSSQPAVLSNTIQTFKGETTDYMDRSLAHVALAADDGDYFKRKMQVDETMLVVEGFVDLIGVLEPATELAHIPSAILFPGWKVVGKEMGTLVVKELADEVTLGLIESAVRRDVAATPMTFFATGGNPSQGLQGPILRAITDTYYVIVPMNDSLERNFSEVLARAVAANRATFISRADETLAHLPILTEAEQAAYVTDLTARQDAGYWLSVGDLRYQTNFLNAVRTKREEDEHNFVKIVVVFVSETAIKAVAFYFLDGPGLAAVNFGALVWHAYLNKEAVKEDQRMRDLALAIMHAGYRSQSILFTNGLSALSLIRAKTPPPTPDGAMLSVDLRRTADVWGFWQDVYADIQIENTSPITAYFGVKAYFEKPQKRLGLDLGGETLQLVEGMTDQATGQTMPVVELAPHEVQTLRMYLKKNGEYDYGMPRTGEPIRFNLYAYTDYGAWLVHAMPGVEFRPQPATALAQVASEAGTTSGQQIAGAAPDDGTPFPLMTRVGSESGSITYTLATYASNPYPQPLAAIISQALPAQVHILDAHGGLVTGNQIMWYVEIQPREQAVLRYDFAYAGFGVTVTLPGVNMSFYDAASSADATLTGQPTSFQAKSPLWAQATASLRVGPNTQQLVPATVSNLDTSASHQGSLILRVTDITGTQILSTATSVSLPAANSQAYGLSYTSPVVEGLYILEVTLRQGDVTQSLINDLLTVRMNRIYLPLVLRN